MNKTTLKRIIVFAVAVALVMCGQAAVFASELGTDTMRLDTPDESGNTPFYVDNMFPGDSVTKDFTVRVDHRKPITLYYHADVRPGYEKLAEVLMVKIEIPQKAELLYDGLMRDMPNSVETQLEASEKTVVYRITAYLDTSVGNDYQAKTLIADFRWWYAEEENPPVIPPFDYTNPVPIKPVAEKILDGEYPRGRKFSFELRDAEGNTLQTVKNRDGIIEFDTIRFDKVGTYTYTLTEVVGRDANVAYDPTVYTMIVDVTREGSELVAEVTYLKDGEIYRVLPRFVNITEDGETTDVETEPSETEPSETEPSETEPSETEPSVTEPSDGGDTPSTDDVPTPDNPKTGNSRVTAYVVMVVCTVAAIVVVALGNKRKGEVNDRG